jgi:hypothetical protein
VAWDGNGGLADLAYKATRDTFKTSVAVGYQYTATSNIDTFDAIFDNAYEEQDLGGEQAIVVQRPYIDVRLLDLDETPAQDDYAAVNGTYYVVTETRFDGQGGCKLFLVKT